jgi:gluconokinase
LKRSYRQRLALGPAVKLVLLRVPPETLRARLATRTGHFMAPSLLASQLPTLDAPGDDELVIDAARPVDEVVAAVRAAIER